MLEHLAYGYATAYVSTLVHTSDCRGNNIWLGYLEQELNPSTMNASSISVHKGMSEHPISSIEPNPYIWFIPSCYIIQSMPININKEYMMNG